MENIGIKKMVEELKRLNSSAKFDMLDESEPPTILCNVNAEGLVFPQGYYYNTKNGVTNKHNTDSGQYECFHFMYSPDHFSTAKSSRNKKSFFVSRISGY